MSVTPAAIQMRVPRQPDHLDSSRISPQHLRGYLTADPQECPVQLEFADVRDRLRCTDRVGGTGSSPVATRFTGNHGGALLTGFDRVPSGSAGSAYVPSRHCRRHLNNRFALMSLPRAISPPDALGSSNCSIRCRLNSVGKFGRFCTPPDTASAQRLVHFSTHNNLVGTKLPKPSIDRPARS